MKQKAKHKFYYKFEQTFQNFSGFWTNFDQFYAHVEWMLIFNEY
jgi:hypothetical protein